MSQTAEYVHFRGDLRGGKLKNLGAGAQKCTSVLHVLLYHVLLCHVLIHAFLRFLLPSTRMLPISMGG